MDIAEHMFSKLPAACVQRNPILAEDLADLFYDIGKDMLTRSQHELAVTWLQRSYEVLSQHTLEELRPDANELRLCILHGLGKYYHTGVPIFCMLIQ